MGKYDYLFDGLSFQKVKVGRNMLHMDGEGMVYRLEVNEAYIAIECADNLNEAERGLFDDAALFNVEESLESTLELVRKELESYADNAPAKKVG